MADEPQQTPPSNNSRITAMLQDLAAQRAAGNVPAPVRPQNQPPSRPPQPVASAPVGAPPANLPTTPAPRPVAPAPAVPQIPRPATSVPPVSQSPAVAPIPRPSVPPPAPKESPVAPMPAVPKPPVQPSPAPIPVAPPIAPAAPKPAPIGGSKDGYSAELRTMSGDIGNIKVGQAPAGIKQATPAVPAPTVSVPPPPSAPVSAPRAPTAPSIVVPSSSVGSSRKFIYLAIGAVVLIGITYALVMMLGGSGTEPTPTPSPSESASPSPTLTGKVLRSYFGNPGPSINLQSVSTGKTDLMNGLVSVQPAAGQATSIAIQHQGNAATIATFLEDAMGGTPYNLGQSMLNDWVLLAFGQSEVFDATGVKSSDTNGGTRLVIIWEISDASQANQAMQAWEADDPAIGNLATAFAPIFSYDTTKRIVTGFSGGTYRQIPVRYWNFPYADHSIDYAIVTASNNKNYLVLAASRQAAFFAIDQLMQ